LTLQAAEQAPGAERFLPLREAVRLALARAPEVLLAQAEVAKATEALREARSMNRPQATIGTGIAYNNGFPLSIEGAAPSIFQAALSQAILSKKNNNLIRESEAGSAASQAGSESARNNLTAKTILLYSELHQARLVVPVLQEQHGTAVNNTQVTESLLQAGRARPLDLTQARVAEANLEQQLLVARERVRMAEAGLRSLTGISEKESIRTERPEIDSDLLALPPDALYLRALETHPAIREAQANVRAREFHVEAEKGDNYPQMTIVSQYALFSKTNNYQEFFNRFTRNNYILGLSVQVPVFSGFRVGARVAQSRQDAEMARLQLQRLQSDLKLNLERSASDVRIANGAAGLARLEVAAGEEKLKISETMAQAGRIDPKELSEARMQLLEKRAALIEAERTLIERQVALLQTAGSLPGIF
jgi:outer membrane protein TolC